MVDPQAASWASVHVAYHDAGGQDDLLLDAVRPLFARVGAHGVRAYFQRHWRRGPHLRLNTHATPEEFAALVRPAVGEVVGSYLRTHPSAARPDPEALLPMHRRLAEYEAEEGPLLPWYPDNTICEAAYDPRVHVLGSREAADLLAGFHTDATAWAFRVLDRVRRREASRLGVAFDLMIATAHATSHFGITGGFVSFRSHSEAFLCAWPEGPALRPSWDEAYAAQQGVLTDRVRAVVSAIDGSGPGAPDGDAPDGGAPGGDGGRQAGEPAVIRDWLGVLAPTVARAESLLEAGLSLGMRPSPGSPGQRDPATAGQFARLTALSPFHRELESDPTWWQQRESTSFLRYRFAFNCLYLTLTRLGVTPTERFRLCYWAANAVEDAYGVSAMELIRNRSRGGDGGGGDSGRGGGVPVAAGTPAAGGATGGAR